MFIHLNSLTPSLYVILGLDFGCVGESVLVIMHSMMKVTVTVLFLALLLNVYVQPAPTPGQESDFPQQWKNDDNPCVHNGERMEICQRCAKQTKSPIVYPMC